MKELKHEENASGGVKFKPQTSNSLQYLERDLNRNHDLLSNLNELYLCCS
jgi:hypothetical protein